MLVCDRAAPRHYREGAKTYFSVSQICALLNGGVAASEAALQRGHDLHLLFGLLCAHAAGRGPAPTVPPCYAEAAAAMQRWLVELQPTIEAIEQPYAHPMLPYAGTPDLVCTIGGRRGVVDLKTGQEARWHAVQLEAYRRMVEPTGGAWVLYLHPDPPGYRFLAITSSPRHWAAFQNALHVLLWREYYGR